MKQPATDRARHRELRTPQGAGDRQGTDTPRDQERQLERVSHIQREEKEGRRNLGRESDSGRDRKRKTVLGVGARKTRTE